MNWSDEIRLSRLPDAEAGLLCKVRLTFKGTFVGCATAADDVFGPGWRERAERLRRAGVLKVKTADGLVRLTVIVPGDKKRERVRLANRKYRAKKEHHDKEV